MLAACAFHREIENAVAANRRLAKYHERGYRLHGVVGIEHPTNQSAALTAEALEVLQSYPASAEEGVDHGGDGTVPRVSASPMEADDESGAMFAGTRHASLQNADAVLTQLRGWLSGVDPLRAFRAGRPVRLSVALDDVYPVAGPVQVAITPSAATAEIRWRLERVALPDHAGAADDGPGTVVAEGARPAVDGVQHLEVPHAGLGLYRLTLAGGEEVEPVDDLVVVAPD